MTQASLPHSLAREVTRPYVTEWAVACRPRGRDWRCLVENQSGPTPYAVRVSGRCWSAVDVGLPAPDTPRRRARGCVGLRDQLRIGDRLSPFR